LEGQEQVTDIGEIEDGLGRCREPLGRFKLPSEGLAEEEGGAVRGCGSVVFVVVDRGALVVAHSIGGVGIVAPWAFEEEGHPVALLPWDAPKVAVKGDGFRRKVAFRRLVELA